MKAMVIDGVSLPFCSTHLLQEAAISHLVNELMTLTGMIDIHKLLDEKQNQTKQTQ